MKEKTVLETYEEKREWVREFNLTSDLFACKVFEDVETCQELCRILLRDQSMVLKSVRTQYVIRSLETHSMELDILAERDSGDMVGIEIQMYEETAPLKRTRYYRTETFPRIVERVRHFKIHKKGVDIMCEIADRIRNEGKIEGKAEGRAEGRLESKIEDILELLEELGKVPQRIVELITEEDNMSVLSRWLKSAARAGSIAEFEANM